MEFDRNVVGDDRVKFEVLASTPPHPLSPYGESVFGYNAVKTSLRQMWADDDLVVVPGSTNSLTRASNLIVQWDIFSL